MALPTLALKFSLSYLNILRNSVNGAIRMGLVVGGDYRKYQGTHQINHVRAIRTTGINYLREIVETTKDDGTLVIEGVLVESDRKGQVLGQQMVQDPTVKDGSCALCRLNLDLHHTDVLILSQFLSPTGRLVSQRVTGLCPKQQALVKNLVDQAKKAGLMINLTPANCHKDPHKRFQWKAFNRYFVPEKSGSKIKKYRSVFIDPHAQKKRR